MRFTPPPVGPGAAMLYRWAEPGAARYERNGIIVRPSEVENGFSHVEAISNGHKFRLSMDLTLPEMNTAWAEGFVLVADEGTEGEVLRLIQSLGDLIREVHPSQNG